MKKMAVVGCGLVGRAWAISFARGGLNVALWDQDRPCAEAALAFIDEILVELEDKSLLNGASPAEIRSRISIADSLEDAVHNAVHIQENTPEDVAIKRVVFAQLDKLAAPETVISSSTSAILPSLFTEGLAGRDRCLVSHPLNPPYLIPAVEIVPAPWTSEATVLATSTLLESIGHAPIVMKREVEGFVMNRLQGALLEEAFRMVEKGYASAEDIDIALREGLALRWSFMGPFETIDLNAPGGVRDYVERYEGIYKPVFEQADWRANWTGPVLDDIEDSRRKRLSAEDLGKRQVWRDKKLMALMAHKKQSEDDLGK